MMVCSRPTHDVTPAKAGAYPEIDLQPQGRQQDHLEWEAISRWIPAFAGMTSCGWIEQGRESP
jgi:hypothetical protein